MGMVPMGKGHSLFNEAGQARRETFLKPFQVVSPQLVHCHNNNQSNV
jgi:hypothetical protein